MRYLILNHKRKAKKIINYLVSKTFLPQIQRRLNIYAEDDSFQIEILNNKISYRKKNRLKAIYIKNKNIKYFFKTMKEMVKSGFFKHVQKQYGPEKINPNKLQKQAQQLLQIVKS